MEYVGVGILQRSAMANSDKCQSDEGNFPLIRQANQVTASLMWEALEVALEVVEADGNISYPGIPSYNAPNPKQE